MGEAVMMSEGGGDGQCLKKMVLRVLLVEADDATRQIIAALLRKCSYRGSPSLFFHFVSSFCSFNIDFKYFEVTGSSRVIRLSVSYPSLGCGRTLRKRRILLALGYLLD